MESENKNGEENVPPAYQPNAVYPDVESYQGNSRGYHPIEEPVRNCPNCKTMMSFCGYLILSLMIFSWPAIFFLPRAYITETDCETLNSKLIIWPEINEKCKPCKNADGGMCDGCEQIFVINVNARWCDNEKVSCYNDTTNITRPVDNWHNFISQRATETYQKENFQIGSIRPCYYNKYTLEFDGYYRDKTDPWFWFIMVDSIQLCIVYCCVCKKNDRRNNGGSRGERS